MPSHIHLFKPGAAITCTASDDIIGGRLVEITGDREVAHAQGGSEAVFGVAATDAAAGESVLVLRGGVQNLIAVYTLPAGRRIISAGDGKVDAAAGGETGIGLAITSNMTNDEQLVQAALDF